MILTCCSDRPRFVQQFKHNGQATNLPQTNKAPQEIEKLRGEIGIARDSFSQNVRPPSEALSHNTAIDDTSNAT